MRFAAIVMAGLAALGVAACAAGSTLPRPAAPDESRAQSTWPGTSLADLQRGRELVAARCSACHQPVAPTAYSPERWPSLVGEMAPRAHLTADERVAVERYLVIMSSAGR